MFLYAGAGLGQRIKGPEKTYKALRAQRDVISGGGQKNRTKNIESRFLCGAII